MHISGGDRIRCYRILSIGLPAIYARYQLVLLGTHLLRPDRHRDDLRQESHLDSEDELSVGSRVILQRFLHHTYRPAVLGRWRLREGKVLGSYVIYPGTWHLHTVIYTQIAHI